jgi:hypothetical protein
MSQINHRAGLASATALATGTVANVTAIDAATAAPRSDADLQDIGRRIAVLAGAYYAANERAKRLLEAVELAVDPLDFTPTYSQRSEEDA